VRGAAECRTAASASLVRVGDNAMTGLVVECAPRHDAREGVTPSSQARPSAWPEKEAVLVERGWRLVSRLITYTLVVVPRGLEVRMGKLRLVLAMLLLLTPIASSYASGAYGRGSVFLGVGAFGGFGFGGFWPPIGWGYAPPPAWTYAPSAAWASVPPAMAMSPPATASPTALAAPSATVPSAAAISPPKDAVWYYCPATSSYYPYVATCAVAWQTVPTTPPRSNLVHGPARAAPAPTTPERAVRGIGDTPAEAFLRGTGGPHEGESRVVAEFTNSSGQPCQERQHTVVVDGTHQRATAIVCERSNGRWVIATEEATN
jgi:hypothetical protein